MADSASPVVAFRLGSTAGLGERSRTMPGYLVLGRGEILLEGAVSEEKMVTLSTSPIVTFFKYEKI